MKYVTLTLRIFLLNVIYIFLIFFNNFYKKLRQFIVKPAAQIFLFLIVSIFLLARGLNNVFYYFPKF